MKGGVNHKCAYCEAWGSHGYSEPGPAATRKSHGTLWVCKDHVPQAEERWSAAYAPKERERRVFDDPPPKPARKAPARKPKPKPAPETQGSLL